MNDIPRYRLAFDTTETIYNDLASLPFGAKKLLYETLLESFFAEAEALGMTTREMAGAIIGKQIRLVITEREVESNAASI